MNNQDFAQALVSHFIYRELIEPQMILASLSSKTPEWDKLRSIVNHKYGSYYSGRTIAEAKANWFYLKEIFLNTQNT